MENPTYTAQSRLKAEVTAAGNSLKTGQRILFSARALHPISIFILCYVL